MVRNVVSHISIRWRIQNYRKRTARVFFIPIVNSLRRLASSSMSMAMKSLTNWAGASAFFVASARESIASFSIPKRIARWKKPGIYMKRISSSVSECVIETSVPVLRTGVFMPIHGTKRYGQNGDRRVFVYLSRKEKCASMKSVDIIIPWIPRMFPVGLRFSGR